jgi:hypothetical protein
MKALKIFLSRHMFEHKPAHQSVQVLQTFVALAPVHVYKPLIVANHGSFYTLQNLGLFQKGDSRHDMTLLSFQRQDKDEDMSNSSVLNSTSKTSFYTSMEFSTLVVMR